MDCTEPPDSTATTLPCTTSTCTEAHELLADCESVTPSLTEYTLRACRLNAGRSSCDGFLDAEIAPVAGASVQLNLMNWLLELPSH